VGGDEGRKGNQEFDSRGEGLEVCLSKGEV